MTYAQMVKKFQCPGCVAGSSPKCGHYNLEKTNPGARCTAHVLGTSVNFRPFALGLPTGFNLTGRPAYQPTSRNYNQLTIRLFPKGEAPQYNNLNVPVWRLESEGFLFVRTYSPRIDSGCVDVIEGGTAELCPQAIDVGDFYEDID